MTLRVPCSGTSVYRWIDNFIAWPWRGLHLGWYIEARRIAERVIALRPSTLTLHGHSRGAVVALYIAVMVRTYNRHVPITVRATASPRQWWRRKWAAHYGRYLASCNVQIINARGDIVTYAPPWLRHDARVRWVGPRRWLSIKAHDKRYIEQFNTHDGG